MKREEFVEINSLTTTEDLEDFYEISPQYPLPKSNVFASFKTHRVAEVSSPRYASSGHFPSLR